MTISAGNYTIGSGGDYENLTDFAADIAANVTGNLIATVISDVTQTAYIQFYNKNLNGHRITVNNSIIRRNPTDKRNKILFDTSGGPFQGFGLRQDNSSTGGSFEICNQYMESVFGSFPTGGAQTAQIYVDFRFGWGFDSYVHNNVMSGPWPEGQTLDLPWYAEWLVGGITGINYNHYFYNNVLYGYSTAVICQNTFNSRAILANNSHIRRTGVNTYFTLYSTDTTRFYNNLCVYIGATGCIGDRNLQVGASSLTGGTNYPYIPIVNSVESTELTDYNYMRPKTGSLAMHNGITPPLTGVTGIDGYYFGYLPKIQNDITIGAISRRMQNNFVTT